MIVGVLMNDDFCVYVCLGDKIDIVCVWTIKDFQLVSGAVIERC